MISFRSLLLVFLASSSVAFAFAPPSLSRPMTRLSVAVDPDETTETEEPVPFGGYLANLESSSLSDTLENKLASILPEDFDTEEFVEQAKTTFSEMKTKLIDFVESEEVQELSANALQFAKDVSGQVFKKIEEYSEANAVAKQEEEDQIYPSE